MSTEIDYWRDEKPEFKDEGVFISAIWFKDHWEYSLWEAKWVSDGYDGEYIGLCDDEGDEWGDWDDLKAHKYLIITPPQKPENQ